MLVLSNIGIKIRGIFQYESIIFVKNLWAMRALINLEESNHTNRRVGIKFSLIWEVDTCTNDRSQMETIRIVSVTVGLGMKSSCYISIVVRQQCRLI